MHDKVTDKNLVTSWRATLAKDGVSEGDAIKSLNAAVGRSYRVQHINRMKEGTVAPGAATINYMMKAVLPELLAEKGLNPRAIKDVIDQLHINIEGSGS